MVVEEEEGVDGRRLGDNKSNAPRTITSQIYNNCIHPFHIRFEDYRGFAKATRMRLQIIAKVIAKYGTYV